MWERIMTDPDVWLRLSGFETWDWTGRFLGENSDKKG